MRGERANTLELLGERANALDSQSQTNDLAVADSRVRADLPALVVDMLERAKQGDKTSLELLHRYYVQPIREEEVTRRERTPRAPTLPPTVTASLTKFSAMLVKGETLTLPARPAQGETGAPLSITAGATLAPDATGQPAPGLPPAAIGREAAANPGGDCADAWDPSRPQLAAGDHTNVDGGGDEKVKRCAGCGHPITDRKRVGRARFCLPCAEEGRRHSLAESARKQAERRTAKKLQEEHDGAGNRMGS